MKLTRPSRSLRAREDLGVLFMFGSTLPPIRLGMGPDQGGAIGRSWRQGDPSSRPAELCFQLQSFAETLGREPRRRPPDVPPPGRPGVQSLEVAHPQGDRPLGAGGLPPTSPSAVTATRLLAWLPARAYFPCALLFA